jgi:hypothetical protein
MAKHCALSRMAIHRVWHGFALEPRRTETFKLSSDPLFIEKVRNIVGLHLNPPDRTLVLSVDGKSSVSGTRSQPTSVAHTPPSSRSTHS